MEQSKENDIMYVYFRQTDAFVFVNSLQYKSGNSYVTINGMDVDFATPKKASDFHTMLANNINQLITVEADSVITYKGITYKGPTTQV